VVALGNLGLVAAQRRDYPTATRFYLRSLEVAETVGELRMVAEILEELATVESVAGDAGRAATLFGAARQIREDIGAPVVGPSLDRLDGARATVAQALGDPAFTAADRAGRQMSLQAAVAFAQGGPPPVTRLQPG
jgi:transposase-like protein